MGIWIRTDADAPHKLQAENIRLRTDLAAARANLTEAIDVYNADRRRYAEERVVLAAITVDLGSIQIAAADYIEAHHRLCDTDTPANRVAQDTARQVLEAALAAHGRWQP